MRLSSLLLRFAAVLSVLLLPAAGQGQTTHTWCTTGAPIPATSDAIVSYVCNQTGFANCCAVAGRWRR